MGAPLTGKLTVSGTAQQLTQTGATTAFIIKAPLSNSNPVFIGNNGVSSSNGYQLDPGDFYEYERSSFNGQNFYQLNLSDFYAVGTGPDVVTWLASP